MTQTIKLTAPDGHSLSAYLAEPAGRPRGGIIVIQEVFGVTRHIREVADQYAAAGFLTVAPALFDRLERDVDVPYGDVKRGLGYMQAMTIDTVMLDVQAALDRVRAAGRVGIVGYCWGGQVSFRAAARLAVDAAVAYYGGGIQLHVDERPRVPVMLHFGERDTHIPPAAVAEIKAAFPQGIYHLYPADHGFNCTDRASFDPSAASLALERSVAFFHQHIG